MDRFENGDKHEVVEKDDVFCNRVAEIISATKSIEQVGVANIKELSSLFTHVYENGTYCEERIAYILERLSINQLLLPYVGERYGEVFPKILLVGESHYVPELFNDDAIKNLDVRFDNLPENGGYNRNESLYTQLLQDTFPFMYGEERIDDIAAVGYVCTARVEAQVRTDYQVYAKHAKKRMNSNFRICFNAATEGYDALKDYCMYKDYAYVNYYQKPASNNGKSVKESDYISQLSYERFMQIVNILNPDIIIVGSAKVSRNLKLREYSRENTKLIYTYHMANNAVFGRKVGDAIIAMYGSKYDCGWTSKEILISELRDFFSTILGGKNGQL